MWVRTCLVQRLCRCAPLDCCSDLTVVAGTYVTQLLRDDFGAKATLANAVVWPHNAGEVIVQNYNSLLTVSHLAQVSKPRPRVGSGCSVATHVWVRGVTAALGRHDRV